MRLLRMLAVIVAAAVSLIAGLSGPAWIASYGGYAWVAAAIAAAFIPPAMSSARTVYGWAKSPMVHAFFKKMKRDIIEGEL